MRIRNHFIRISYVNDATVTHVDVKKHFKEHPNALIFKSPKGTSVILHKEDRFDIRTEAYIKKNFKIGYILPLVTPSSIDEATLIVEGKDSENNYVWSSGKFEEIHTKYNQYLEANEHLAELEKAKEKIKKLEIKLKKRKPAVKINIHNYMIPDIYRGVKMNPFGKEDFSVYTFDDVLSLVDNMKYPLSERDYERIFKKLVELIHYDERFPQNHNIHVTAKSTQSPKCIVYVETGWDMTVNLDKVVRKLCIINLEFMRQTYNNFIIRCDALDDETSYLLRLVYERMKDYNSSMNEMIGETLYTLTKSKINYREIE